MAQMGEIVDGKYELLREIGRGGMSVVYLAMDKRLNKQWAIKEFRKDKDDVSKQVALKALLDEANLMKKLDHPTLPRIVDIIDDHNTVYVVMDYIEGESLNKVLDAYGAQPQEAVIEWAKQLSEVLDYLHTQSPPVIYRDMKPANIMLKPDGTIRLIDFGIAREYKEGKAGDTEAIGTRGYAAPEQFGGRGQTDARTDIYSLGVTLYHLVTGKNPAEPPYEIYPIRHWNPSFSSGLEWLIQKCTQLNPSDRYQSCAEVTYVLENLDKFETEYKKAGKTKINLFITSVIMTVVFGIASGACFGISSQMLDSYIKTEMGKGTYEGYNNVLEKKADHVEAYEGILDLLAKEPVIDIGDDQEKDSNKMYEEDLRTYFDENNRLSVLREADIEAYSNVCFDLGRVYWNAYEDDSVAPNKALQYFEHVLNAGSDMEEMGLDNYETAGLTSEKYSLARLYYLLAYFHSSKSAIANQDLNYIEVSNAAVVAGIYGVNEEEQTVENPYFSFWMTMKELVQLLDENMELTDKAKLESLDKLVYLLYDNKDVFHSKTKEKVNGTEMTEMISMITKVIHNLEDNMAQDENNIERLESIKKDFNSTIPYLEATYNIDAEEVK